MSVIAKEVVTQFLNAKNLNGQMPSFHPLPWGGMEAFIRKVPEVALVPLAAA